MNYYRDVIRNDRLKKTEELFEKLEYEGIYVIPDDEIRLINPDYAIDEGSFGYVFEGVYKNIDVAVKELKLENTIDSETFEEILREIYSSTSIKHEFVPRFHGLWKGNNSINLVYDMVKGKNLCRWMSNNKGLEKTKIKIAIYLCDILEVIHAKKIIHRDLKPENIIIKDCLPYLIDFGVSKLSSHTFTETNNARGTIRYFPPENCKDINPLEDDEDEYNSERYEISTYFDIWSLGCVICYMMTEKVPWTKVKKTGYEIVSDEIVKVYLKKRTEYPIPKEIDDNLKKILSNCFRINPIERYNARQLRNALYDYYENMEDEYY